MKEAKFAFIYRHLDEHGVSAMCRALGVTRQGYYQWASRPDSAHDLRDREPARLIGDEYDASIGIYGAPKVFMGLRQKGVPASASPGALSLFECIEAFYNRLRIHSALGWLNPAEFEERHASEGRSKAA